ncbi:DUF2474 domain-containing protein [Pseudomonas sp. MWU12-2312b]|uniref:DUF2474 domain-containing protein n=1 Tax=Pseudomonas moorei TaxID=395599 RepID=UPI000D419845|nr:DUF2474 domain-containing protein [Pseudomonas moorei]PPA01301.1 DUF2474 domain-containing protein [Pseudomonas sp. MWU12-2312b]
MERSNESGKKSKSPSWYRRVMWLIAIWFGSVVALGVVAILLRLMMKLAGMTTH